MRDMAPMTLDDAAAAPFRFTAAILLDADQHAVFEELRDPSMWFPLMHRSVWHTGATSGVGAERIVELTGLGKFRERMLVWDTDSRVAFTMVAGTSPLAARMLEDYRLSRVDGKTRLDWVVAAYPTAIGRVLTPATRATFGMLARGVRRNLGKRAGAYPRGKQAV
ncbi:MAG TPA: SRPBCC family protein [Kofleriaceae bacterium]|nr:SRPBCC family protein [Kofleriaceae bacterium]